LYAEHHPFPAPHQVVSLVLGPVANSTQKQSPVFQADILTAQSLSPLKEYHFDAAHYHNESAAYHDQVSEYYDSAAEYHDNAVQYHDSQAKFHRVQFLSPIASYFSNSSESLLEPLLHRAMQESVTGSIHGSPDLPGTEARLSTSSTLRPASIMSATDPQHAALPVARDFAQPVAQGSNTSEAAPTGHPIKWIIRAKTPSFSSDSEQDVYNGPSVSMNADKGWEPDVKKVKKKSKAGSSRQGSSSSTASTVKRLSAIVPQPGLQVPSFGIKGTHSRTTSGISGLSRITTAPGVTGGTGTTGYLDQDELMTRMLNPAQQVRNAENHVKAMREALAKAFKDREDAEDRTAVAEALLKSSLASRANERGETVLMEKYRLTEEKLNVSQALLEKSRERNVEYEDRMLRSEALVQKMADKMKVGVPAIVNSADAEVAEIQSRLKEAIERAEKAEQRFKDAEAGSDGDHTQGYKDAIGRAEIAEKRAQAAEELQEKDRLWTVDADERAVNAENCAIELRAELTRSQNIIGDHQILLMRARSRAEKAEQDLKDAESELEAFENRAIEYEKEVYEFRAKFHSLKRYTDKLQDHHNGREKEYMACNDEWKSREEDFVNQATELKRWGDEGVARSKEEIKKLEEKVEEMAHDKDLIVKTFADAIAKIQKAGKVMSQEDVDNLIEWVAKSPELKKGKELGDSVAVTREKARRTLEGLALTPSLDTEGTLQFEGPKMEAAPVASPSAAVSPAKSNKSEDEEAVLAKQMAAVQREDGVLRLPGMSKGRWYNMNKTPK
jgi:predicted  nucleic acid-binding Zn-ribbon protein